MTATTAKIIVREQEEIALHALDIARGHAVVASFRSPDKNGENEDAAVIAAIGDDAAVLAVADGVGSTRAAHTASAAMVEALGRIRIDRSNGFNARALIVNAIEQTNQDVRDSGSGAATTVAVIELDGNAVRPVHVGDSGVLIVGQRGRLRLQTVAHSPVGYAIEAGVIDEGEAMLHEDRHLVSNVIGSEDMRIEIGGTLTLARHDTVVLATDGVFDNLLLDELINFVRIGPLERAAERVMHAVHERMTAPDEGVPSKPDDTTLILYRRAS